MGHCAFMTNPMITLDVQRERRTFLTNAFNILDGGFSDVDGLKKRKKERDTDSTRMNKQTE
jgi:hypothetical protein